MNYYHLLLILLLTFSCSTPHNDLYKFDPNSLAEEKLTLTQIAEDIIYIPLDNSFKIRLINDVIITRNFIFLSSDEGVFKFDHDGKMIKKIGNKGRGPEEYINCANFAVDDLNKCVYIKDRSNIIKVYSIDGSYIRDINLQDIISGIEKIAFYNSKIFLSQFMQFGDSQYNWIIIDTLGTIIKKKERTIPNFVSNWLEGSRIYKFENQLFYWNPYNDTVFSISQDLKYKPSFLFGQGNYRLPKSNFNPAQEITHFMLIRSLFETKRFIVLRYSYNSKGNIAFIDKKNKKSFLAFIGNSEIGGITNDFDGGINFQPITYYAEKEQEYMIGYFDPYKLKNHVASIEFINSVPKYNEYKQKVECLAKSLTETDNPVLMFIKLKN